MKIPNVPYLRQKEPLSCFRADAAMALGHWGIHLDEAMMKNVRYRDHEHLKTPIEEIARFADDVERKTETGISTTMFLDPVRGPKVYNHGGHRNPHAFIHEGTIEDDGVWLEENPGSFVNRMHDAREVIPRIRERANDMISEAEDNESLQQRSMFGNVSETPNGWVARFRGNPKEALEKYMDDLKTLEEVVFHTNADIRFGVPPLDKEHADEIHLADERYTIEGFINSGIPTIVRDDDFNHYTLVTGYEDGPLTHDPLSEKFIGDGSGPYKKSGTYLHASMTPECVVLIQPR